MSIATIERMGHFDSGPHDLEIVAIGNQDVTLWHENAFFGGNTWDGEVFSAITEVMPNGDTRYTYLIIDSIAGWCRVEVTLSQ